MATLIFRKYRVESVNIPRFFIFCCTVTIFFVSLSLHAQKTGTLTGSVVDSLRKEPVPGATVIINRLADDTRLGAVVTGMEGEFVIEGLPQKDTLLVDIRYLGYKPWRGLLYLEEPRFAMAPVRLQEGAIELEDVKVEGARLPMIMKGDTLEYNVSAFTTRPYAEIKELFKKLPGLEMSREGGMTYNGQRITKVLVDGREYFGTDGQMAMNTLPVDVVEKIQLMDTDEEEDLRSGNQGERSKTMNIRLKEGLKDFGSVSAGGGTDRRYELMGKYNRFRGESRLTLLGMVNNVNAVDYAEDEVITLLNAGNGITRTLRGGANYSNRWKDGTALSTGYNYTRPHTYQESLKERIQFIVPDSSFTTASNSTVTRRSDDHRVNINTTIPLDSASSLQIQLPDLSHRATNNRTVTRTVTADGAENPVNEQQNTYHTDGKSTTIPLLLGWQKRYSATTHLNITLSGTFSRQDNEDFNLGETTYYRQGTDSTAQFRQQILTDNRTDNYTASINHRFSISRRWSSSWYSTVSYTRSSNKRETWLLDEENNRQIRDSLGTNAFRSRVLNSNTGFSLHYTLEKMELAIGTTLNYNRLSPYDETLQTGITHEFINLAPSLNINYKITDKKRISFSYNAFTSPPSADQLQPVADNTNPLFIREGNPDLEPVFSQVYNLRYNAIGSKGNTFFANLSYRPVKDQVITTTAYDEYGRQVASYSNVDGTRSLYGYLGFSARKPLKTGVLDVKASGNIGYNRDKNFINGELVSSDQWTLGPNVQLRYAIQELLDADIIYAPQYNKLGYDKASGQDQDFIIHHISGSLDLYPLKNLVWGNKIGFIRNNKLPDDFEKSSLLWNMDISWLFLKDKRGELKFRVFDLLKQNRNINRIATQNYIEDTQSNNLQQYFMLSFGYHIR
ncbi:TonB-dependent receptor [Sinomicrobium pectinilyticum]|uniref:TonB-dependent receptor n=1 Tax=Sinomicrobium pectinilyticum TaxID=1084421 RepID=A0A3N0EJK3_SINP1|nr:outer membrane beta-barrel protein [Sinomicrobium pectinilyticum]RNL87897.1 TonB-dependent receptor [Sinomicrobium pectinilyticum]